MHLDKSIFIRADPSVVFAWLAPHRRAAWDRHVVRATPIEGGRFDLVERAFGHRFEAHVATRVEPARLFAWHQERGDYEEHRGAFVLEHLPGGTRVRLVADVEFPYVMPEVVTEAELRRVLSEGADDALLRLKALAEGRAPAS